MQLQDQIDTLAARIRSIYPEHEGEQIQQKEVVDALADQISDFKEDKLVLPADVGEYLSPLRLEYVYNSQPQKVQKEVLEKIIETVVTTLKEFGIEPQGLNTALEASITQKSGGIRSGSKII